MKQRTADLLLLLVAIIWGGGFPAVGLALEAGILPFQLIGLRFIVAFILMALLFRKHLKKLTKLTLFAGVLGGALLFVGFGFQTIGIQYTTASKNAFITSTYVLLIPLINLLLFKKKINVNQTIGIAVMMLGISVLSLEQDFTINMGDFLTLISAFGFAGQIIVTGIYASRCNSYAYNTVQMGTASLLAMICAVSFESWPVITGQGVLAILYLGVLSTLFAFLVQAVAQKYTTDTKVGLILSTEAVFGAILSVMILNDPITMKLWVGGTLVFLAIIMIESKPISLVEIKKYIFKTKLSDSSITCDEISHAHKQIERLESDC